MTVPAKPPLRPARVFALLRDASLAFSQDNAPRLAAALAYYAFSAIAPLLFLVTVVAGYFLGQAKVRAQLFNALNDSVGPQVSTFIQTLLPKLSGGNLTWASVIGGVTVFLTATSLFVQLQGSLNSLWGLVPPNDTPPTLLQNVWLIVKTRLIAFALVLLFGAFIIAFLVGNTVLSAVASRLGDTIGFGAFFVRIGTFLLSMLLFTPVFASLYKFLPSVKLPWREVWVGSAVTAALFTLGQVLIGLYFGRIAGNSPYGAAAALFLMLLWIYYSSMIVFFGAEITWVYSQQYGTRQGGADNTEKAAAVTEHARQLDAGASGPEARARAGQARVAAKKDAAEPRSQQDTRPQGTATPPARPQDALPSVSAALAHAAVAVLAVPSVIVLRAARLVTRRR